MIRALLVFFRGNLTTAAPSLAVDFLMVLQVLPPSVDSRIRTFLASGRVPLTSHSTTCFEPGRTLPPLANDVTRNGPAFWRIRSVTWARPTPPPLAKPSRAVSRKCIAGVFEPAVPTYPSIGRNSEKQSRIRDDTFRDGLGHVPVLALVLPRRIWARSGKVRDGLVRAMLRPFAALPNTRNSGPLRLVLESRAVPLRPPMSICSHR